jgi:transposase
MKVVYRRCCGLDVHKKTIVACLVTPEGSQMRTFETMTGDLLNLSDWLTANKCEAVAMESTGVYWRPVHNILEGNGMDLLLVNAQHFKAVKGRKTDLKDAEWLADLLQHGLLKGSFVPERPHRELRDIVRYRRGLIQDRSREASRVMKVLEGANIKLQSVISDILGVSGRAMLELLASGETDPSKLADCANSKIKATREELERALKGLMSQDQRLMLSTQLRHIDFLTEQIDELSSAIEERMAPFEEQIARLDGIPGIGRRGTEELIAEIGVDMSRFPSAEHLCSWARVCPGLNESAGKRKNTSTGKGNRYLRAMLAEAAWAASKKKNSYLNSQFWRIAGRRGKQRATIAVSNSILRIVYYMLRDGTEYKDLGADYLEKRSFHYATRAAKGRLETLGWEVVLTRKAA